jgi:hypothetical protein
VEARRPAFCLEVRRSPEGCELSWGAAEVEGSVAARAGELALGAALDAGKVPGGMEEEEGGALGWKRALGAAMKARDPGAETSRSRSARGFSLMSTGPTLSRAERRASRRVSPAAGGSTELNVSDSTMGSSS